MASLNCSQVPSGPIFLKAFSICGFEKARKAFHEDQGIGRRFVAEYLPFKMFNSSIPLLIDEAKSAISPHTESGAKKPKAPRTKKCPMCHGTGKTFSDHKQQTSVSKKLLLCQIGCSKIVKFH